MRIYDGRTHFSQWDQNVMITSADFKIGDEVHITNNRLPNAMTVLVYDYNGKAVVDVPNILLQTTYPIIVFRYIQDGKSGYTLDKREFTVNQKPKPDDYVYTETEIYTIKTTVEKALKEVKESGEFDGKDGKDGKDGINGKDGYTPKKGVDYYSLAEKAELVEEISRTVTGDIETALDGIIAIQNELIGGGSSSVTITGTCCMCGTEITTSDAAAGERGECGNCGYAYTVCPDCGTFHSSEGPYECDNCSRNLEEIIFGG